MIHPYYLIGGVFLIGAGLLGVLLSVLALKDLKTNPYWDEYKRIIPITYDEEVGCAQFGLGLYVFIIASGAFILLLGFIGCG